MARVALRSSRSFSYPTTAESSARPFLLREGEAAGAPKPRLLERVRVGLGTNQVVVRSAKGDKDRVTILPTVAKPHLARYLERVRTSRTVARPACAARWTGCSMGDSPAVPIRISDALHGRTALGNTRGRSGQEPVSSRTAGTSRTRTGKRNQCDAQLLGRSAGQCIHEPNSTEAEDI